MIKVYGPEEKAFSTNGLGTINPLSCIETKKASLSGWYLTISVDTKYSELVIEDRIVVANTKEKGAQAFRIGNVKKTDRKIEFTALHVLFDAENYILADVRPTNLTPSAYLAWINARTDSTSPFTVGGDAQGTGTSYFIRKTLLEAWEEAESKFEALFDADNFTVRIMDPKSLGYDNGFKVAYGKNIQGVTVQENWDDVCTKILPVGSNGLLLPELYLSSSTQYATPYSKVIEFEVAEQNAAGEAIPEATRITELRTKAREYLEKHAIPKISYTVKSDVPQDLSINDAVYIKHPLADVKANVTAYTYDCESGRVKTLTFGNYDASNRSAYNSQVSERKAAVEKAQSDLQQAIVKVTNAITGNSGGYVVLDPAENPSRILVMNTPSTATAKKVWQWNSSGLGYSKNGINGPYETAITANGEIVADFIKTGAINASLITAGTMLANRIAGGRLTLGGKDNGHGLFIMLDANDKEIGRWSKDGLVVKKGTIEGTTFYQEDSNTFLKIEKAEIRGGYTNTQTGTNEDWIDLSNGVDGKHGTQIGCQNTLQILTPKLYTASSQKPQFVDECYGGSITFVTDLSTSVFSFQAVDAHGTAYNYTIPYVTNWQKQTIKFKNGLMISKLS